MANLATLNVSSSTSSSSPATISASIGTPRHQHPNTGSTPGSAASSNNTFLLSASPSRNRKADNYKPKVITTVGARPACLVNASVTYVGNDQIYAFGGFDQYTDEVYNHVLRLNLQSRQWSLVDNYGDIPGVRMGHTANLWQGDKLLVYGGENEHRNYLSDIIIFDLKTAHWMQPDLHGPPPRGRARHSAVIDDDKLYILGGMTGHNSYVLDDICYLDLKNWTWSRTWKFVPRYDHTSWIWGGRIWVFGGLGEDMERSSEIWWLDLRGTATFDSQMAVGVVDRQPAMNRYCRTSYLNPTQTSTGSTGYAANSSSVQVTAPNAVSRSPPIAPGSISSLKFISSPNLPTQALGTHFHVYSSGCLVDFVTPASMISSVDTSLSALDLETLRWQKLADGKDLFNPSYRWHYCALNEDGTHAWLLGCPTEPTINGPNNGEEYLSDVLPIDLRRLGLLGNSLAQETRLDSLKIPASDANTVSRLSGVGADLAQTFDQAPETGSGTDFIVTAEGDQAEFDAEITASAIEISEESVSSKAIISQSQSLSPPIYVHRLILCARWPHFNRLYTSQMAEFHTKKMHIPEPYTVVRSFLYYLYSDSIAPHPPHGPSLQDVAGMLVMSNIYDMPRLRILCVNRLGRELDIEHAAVIWERAATAGENWLRRRAANYCMLYWGRVVRTPGFRRLSQRSLLDLCEEIDTEGRVVSGEELEALGGLGGVKLGFGVAGKEVRKRRAESVGVVVGDDGDDVDEPEEESMELS